jgi:hypothetical protein
LIARYYVEDWPAGGVTKVIQVCSPNGGTSWGKRTAGVRQSQEAFMTSLTKEARADVLKTRADNRVPTHVEFVCVLGSFGLGGDGIVRSDAQWTLDLQRQGIPAVPLYSTHVTAMRSKRVAEKLVELVCRPQPRWSPEQVDFHRQRLFGDVK